LQWILDIREKVTMPDGTPIPIVLLANKCDLTDISVETDVIGRYCREYNIGAWFITSAKEDNNIGDLHSRQSEIPDLILNYIPDQAMNYLVEQVLELKSVEATRDSIMLHDPAYDSTAVNRFLLTDKLCWCG
jgi:Ras-related protein Rab-32